ncbi:hypothetical protein [Caballeronia sp. S22]|uniref:hypothetical protein n=1 Tax=Caballeronia sp. S22 TaxID=3137182 RepID=UPI003530AE49
MLWRNASGFQHLVNRLSSVVDKIVVILYLRKQAGFIESNYVERLKSGFCLDFSTYAQTRLDTELAEFPLDYRKLIARLDDSSGIELIVRDYDAVRSSSVLPGFLDIIGWPREIALTEERVNTGDPLVDALKNFCRAQLQRKLTNADERLIELIDASIPVRPRMSGKTLRSYVRHFASCNRELAQRFGLPSLVEEPPPERAFGEWRGLGSAPPPDDGMQPVVTLDNLFSKDFVAVVTAAAQRFALMDAALADARMIAGQRLNEIEDLRSRLARAEQHELASAAPEPPPSLPPGEAPEPPPTLRACASAFRAWALYRLRA